MKKKDKKSKKNILIIAYNIPPDGGPGVFRTLKFMKYLPEFGFNSIVLAPKNAPYQQRDSTLLQEIPKTTKIFYSRSFEIRKNSIAQKAINSRRSAQRNIFTIFTPILYWLKNLIFFPDEQIGWIPHSIYIGSKILRTHDIDIIYSTSHPYSGHLIGLYLSKKFKKKWIVDFRDLWTLNPIFPSSKRDRFLERVIIKNASGVILNNKGAFEKMSEYYNEYKDKFTWINNGYDPDDFKHLEDLKVKPEVFSITHTGQFYGNIKTKGKFPRTPKYFLKAFDKFVKDENLPPKKIKINFVGNLEKRDKELIENLKLADYVRVWGYQPKQKALEILYMSNIALLIIGDISSSDTVIAQKLYEYMGLKKFILAITNSQNYKNILTPYKHFILVPEPTNIQMISDALKKIYVDYSTFKKEEFKSIECYFRKNLTEKLVSFIEIILNENKSSTSDQ